MLTINTNLSSLIAQGSMKSSTNKLNQAIERMTTGYKINHAKDNAANYSISTNMSTKISGLQVAEENTLQAIDMVNTALASLSQMSNSVSRLKELSTMLHNDTYANSSKEAINEEARSIINDIYRLKNSSNYNNISLFGGIERAENPDFDGEGIQSNHRFIAEVTRIDTTMLQTIESLDEAVITTGGSYSVSSVEEIEKALAMIADGKLVSAELVLANDVDYSGYIGTHTRASGVNFNGNGYVIKNFTTSNRSFFDGLACNIKNLGFEDVNITTTADKTCVFGDSNIVLENCYAIGKVSSNKPYTGGLVGWGKNAKLKNCFAEIEVQGANYVGGLVGSANNVYIENCYSSGSVNATAGNVGGLVGDYYATNNKIVNCASDVMVKGLDSVGGLIGSLLTTGANFTMENCYSIGAVNSSGVNIGGLIGSYSVAKEINNCYYLKDTSGCSDETKGLGVDVSEMFSLIDSGYLVDYKFELPLPDIYDDPSDNLYSPAFVSFQLSTNPQATAGIYIDLTFKMEGLKDICYLGLTNDASLDKLDKMLYSIANKEIELGALLNRFESALDEISIQYENLISSRSTIREADIAEVSSTYIQQQILQQASATLLATANQSPSIALQLI